MNLLELSQNLRDAVIYFPQDSENRKCKQPQAYGMVDSVADFGTENLKKSINDKDNNLFWSRKWAANGFSPSAVSFDYPVMIAFINNYTSVDAFKGLPGERRFRVDLYAIDVYKYEKMDRSRTACQRREPIEIIEDTMTHLDGIYTYLKGIVKATDNTGSVHWRHRSLLDQLITNGTITSYTVDDKATNSFQGRLRRLNENMITRPYRGRDDNTFGVWGSIEVPLDACQTFAFDFTRSNDPNYTRVITDFGNPQKIVR